MKLSSEDFSKAYSKLPLPIREYLAGDDLGIASEAIGQTHNMHVDTTGILADVISQTLLGFIPPQELPSVLMKELSMPEAEVLTLIIDINQKVFIPLQKKVRDGVAQAEKEAQDDMDEDEPKESVVPVAFRPAPVSVSSPQPPTPTTPVAQPSNAPIRPASPLPQGFVAPAAAPVRVPVQPHYAPAPQTAPTPQPSASVSAPAAQNIHIYVGPQTHAPAPQAIIQPIMMQPISAPIHEYAQVPATQTPVPVASRSMPTPPMAEMPPVQQVPPQLPEFHPAARTMASDMQLVKNLQNGGAGSDPYREPPL